MKAFSLRVKPNRRMHLRESLAPLFSSLLDEQEHERWEADKRLRPHNRSIPHRVVLSLALYRSRLQQSPFGLFLIERPFGFSRIVTIDLKQMVGTVKVLELLVRLALDEAILSVDERVLAQMQKDRGVLLRRIRGGNTVLITAAASRFYLRLFSLTGNSLLRKEIFAALRNINICSPYLLDIVDQSSFETATQLMIRAATDHDVVGARAALDMILGNGPLARTDLD